MSNHTLMLPISFIKNSFSRLIESKHPLYSVSFDHLIRIQSSKILVTVTKEVWTPLPTNVWFKNKSFSGHSSLPGNVWSKDKLFSSEQYYFGRIEYNARIDILRVNFNDKDQLKYCSDILLK